MNRIQWEKYPERDAALAAAIADPTKSWDEIETVTGMSYDACRKRALRMKYPGWDTMRRQRAGHVPAHVSSPKPSGLTGAELWERAELATDLDVRRHQAERLIDVEIPDDRPIGLTFASDQHLRQTGPIMTRRAREDAELIQRTDGLYAALVGDGVDNHIKHREAMANGGDKPKDSWNIFSICSATFPPKRNLASRVSALSRQMSS